MRQTLSLAAYRTLASDTLRLTKLTRASIWHIFLAVLNTPHFASENEKFAVSASLRSAPSIARGCRWGGYSGGKRQNKRPEAIASGFLFWLPLTCLHVFGHRTMRQTSSLTALVGRISKEILPPVRALWARRVERSGTAGKKAKIKKESVWTPFCF